MQRGCARLPHRERPLGGAVFPGAPASPPLPLLLPRSALRRCLPPPSQDLLNRTAAGLSTHWYRNLTTYLGPRAPYELYDLLVRSSFSGEGPGPPPTQPPLRRRTRLRRRTWRATRPTLEFSTRSRWGGGCEASCPTAFEATPLPASSMQADIKAWQVATADDWLIKYSHQ